MRTWWRRQPLTRRIVSSYLVAMAVLLIAAGAFIHQRMQHALDQSIRDDPRSEGDTREQRLRRAQRDEALRELIGQLAAAFSLTLVVAGLVGWRTARAALDPVERMRRTADDIDPGDHDTRLPEPDTDDEIARLARTLNELLDRLNDAYQRERRFVGDASHELRTPLTLLRMQVDLALSRDRSPEELRDALASMRDETERLQQLAQDLLVLARADAGELALAPDDVGVLDAAREVAERFAPLAQQRRRVVEVAVPVGLQSHADPARLDQALTNLVENAMRYGDGTVTIAARTVDDGVEIVVRDEGAGMAPAMVEHAFERFATSTEGRTGEGTGLGLAIVRAIVEAHGGHVGLRTPVGGGTEAWLWLPGGGNEAG